MSLQRPDQVRRALHIAWSATSRGVPNQAPR
jgi:hypothetical protein